MKKIDRLIRECNYRQYRVFISYSLNKVYLEVIGYNKEQLLFATRKKKASKAISEAYKWVLSKRTN